ncbi:MAG: methionine synthase [Candidatus Nanoarchaeia archaeon]
MKIVGASLGECVHIQGVYRFLRLAEQYGHETEFLGPAVSIDDLVEASKDADSIAVSYRLTPENCSNVLDALERRVREEGLEKRDYLFGGTELTCEEAKRSGLFKIVSDGSNMDEVRAYLEGRSSGNEIVEVPPNKILKRIDWKKTPCLRTHFGLPTIEATEEGIKKIAEAGVIDVISLGTDQEAQANFFHPERQDKSRAGAGGVPVRTPEDFKRLWEATQRGNFPTMRTYAGTDDFTKLANMYEQVWGNAWSAVPIFWFNKMDGRGPHDLESSIKGHLDLIKWSAEHDIPVEILEAHHWGMRWAHDSVQVAAAVLGAEVAKACSVKDYIHQYMFNVPPESSFTNELAKMLAVEDLLDPLEDNNFMIYHQTRTGLPSFPQNMEAARGQLASSTMLQMQLKPDIIHVVNYSEPHHAATPEDVISSAYLVNQAVKNALGAPDMTSDYLVQNRKKELIGEARYLLKTIREQTDLLHPEDLARVVTSGIFDAPMLQGNKYARGQVRTEFKHGMGYAVDKHGNSLKEYERIQSLSGEAA